jgi:UDP-N-acetylmuramate dehydrogenase
VLAPSECGFAYRGSVFRRRPGRWTVLAVTYSLRPGGAPTLAYPELARALASRGGVPDLGTTRQAVLELRRGKSMVLDPADPNRRSVGSFFVNPVVSAAEADAIVERALAAGIPRDPAGIPRFAAGPDRVKLSAAWLVERAGFGKGFRRGSVGISSRHSLALVHHGGGRTADLLALARDIRAAVRARFGVELHPEPTFLGFAEEDPLGGQT